MIKINTLAVLFIASAVIGVNAAGRNNAISEEELDCGEDFNCTRVTGISQGNHELDCTIIRPWEIEPGPGADPHPVIAWANGWEQGNVLGQCVTSGYIPGLKRWAQDGPFLVVAANAWSARDTDVLACLQWVVENEPMADANRTGLAGHSQGGGAVIEAGDGFASGVQITATIPMNPYGPDWAKSSKQDGPVMLLGGTDDTTTPPSSYDAAWEAIQTKKGGVNAILDGGTHNSEAWGVDENGTTMTCEEAANLDFGQYQTVTELWWQKHLNGKDRSGRKLKKILGTTPWHSEFAFTSDFEL